jgi:ABC-type multidrug transport system ATPase subunit
VLEISNVYRRFGDVVALDAVGLHVGRGEIVGLVGRNGAGKTTLMRSVMAYSPRTEARSPGTDVPWARPTG